MSTARAAGRGTAVWSNIAGVNDAFDLARFVAAQERVYETALAELRRGLKQSHWIWFIFPQIAGLGWSQTARFYAIVALAEARDYAAHPLLGARLRACTAAMLHHDRLSARDILGAPDDMKFHSSMTLFALASPDEPMFDQALGNFFSGERDPLTLARLGQPQHR